MYKFDNRFLFQTILSRNKLFRGKNRCSDVLLILCKGEIDDFWQRFLTKEVPHIKTQLSVRFNPHPYEAQYTVHNMSADMFGTCFIHASIQNTNMMANLPSN